MKIISNIAVNELKMNKKVTLMLTIGIIIVTILINSVATLALSYQQYMVNLSRSEENWEVRLDNVLYNNLKYIEQDDNIKQILIVQNLGLTENNYNKGIIESLQIMAYDINALENLNISLLTGRLPKNENEIIINKNMNLDLEENLEVVIEGKKHIYKIVGFIEKSDYDKYENSIAIRGAITLCNKEKIDEDERVSVSIITRDISKIYETTQNLIAEINSDVEVKYNEELLNYACISENGSDFYKNFMTITGLFISIIAVTSIAIIYTIFDIVMRNKKKNIACLLSLGATRGQILKIYFIEIAIIIIIAIPIGLLISFALDYLLIISFNSLFKLLQNNLLGTFFQPRVEVDLNLNFSIYTLIISILIICIIVFLSTAIPIIKSKKMKIIDMIKEREYNKINKKTICTPRIIKKIFKEEGNLAYKNIKRSCFKYMSIIISLTISFVLVISTSSYIVNLTFLEQQNEKDYNYNLWCYRNTENEDYSEEIIKKIKETGLINDIYGIAKTSYQYVVLDRNKINESLKYASSKFEALSSNIHTDDGSMQIPALLITFDNETLDKYLKQIGTDILNDGECIVVNRTESKTKYYDELYLTNYNLGDKIIVNSQNRDLNLDFSSIENLEGFKIDNENRTAELNISMVTNIIPKGKDKTLYGDELCIIVNNKTFGETYSKLLNVKYDSVLLEYNINSSDTNKLDELIKNLNIEYRGLTHIESYNFELEQQSIKSEKQIKAIILYSFLGLISILSIMNVFNIIFTNIMLRKREFAELRTIGMSKKQFSKMLCLEGIFYATAVLFIGTIISGGIIYWLYTTMIETEIYAMNIPWITFIISTIALYLIIFISIEYAKRKVNKYNISDVLK